MQELTNFINALKQSQLIETAELKTAVRQFQAEMNSAGLQTAELTIRQLCDFLVQNSLVTSWQAEKLAAGKFRGFFLGKYKLLRVLGAGGMSVVYLAENRLLGQRRAIKVLPKSKIADSSFLERFYLEARAAAALDHLNIVKTYDIDNQEDQHYMVMEFVEGQDLSAVVKQVGKLSIETSIDYLMQAAKALQYAHQAGLIHRDVKPSNFLVTSDGQIKLMDLGLAKFLESSASLTMMHNETMLGTADYLSPEQAINSHEVDQRTDIYSLGGTMYFMIAGHPPFPEGSIAQRLVRHQSVKPPTLKSLRSECPDFLSNICDWLMEKLPENRCQNCGELVRQLQRWVDDPTVSLDRPTPDLSSKIAPLEKTPNAANPVSISTKERDAPPKIVISSNKVASPKTSGPSQATVAAQKIAPVAAFETVEPGKAVDLGTPVKSAPGETPNFDDISVPAGKPAIEIDPQLQVAPSFAIKIQPKSKVAGMAIDTGPSNRIKPSASSASSPGQPSSDASSDASSKKGRAVWMLGGLGLLLLFTIVFLIWVFMQSAGT